MVKSLEQAAKEYGVLKADDKSGGDFKAGVYFAEKWYDVTEELPIINDLVFVKGDDLYTVGCMNESEEWELFCNFEITPQFWRPLSVDFEGKNNIYQFMENANIIEKMPIPEGAKKLCVFGSRTLWDCRVGNEIMNIINEMPEITTIVTTQEPKGACEVGQRVAQDNSLILELHFLNFRFAGGAFEKRSMAAIRASDYVLLIHDGVSHGTANELKYAQKMKAPYCYMRLTPSDDRIDRYEGKNHVKKLKQIDD